MGERHTTERQSGWGLGHCLRPGVLERAVLLCLSEGLRPEAHLTRGRLTECVESHRWCADFHHTGHRTPPFAKTQSKPAPAGGGTHAGAASSSSKLLYEATF